MLMAVEVRKVPLPNARFRVPPLELAPPPESYLAPELKQDNPGKWHLAQKDPSYGCPVDAAFIHPVPAYMMKTMDLESREGDPPCLVFFPELQAATEREKEMERTG